MSSCRPARSWRARWTVLAALVGIVVSMVTACDDDPAVAGQARSPEQAAQGLLDAVRAGRATEALAFLRVQPLDRALLTDEVLTDAVRQAPITHVATKLRRGKQDSRRRVDVTYRVDGQRVADTYTVVQVGRYWFVDETLPTVPVFDDHPGYAAATVSQTVVTTPDRYDRSTAVLEPAATPVLPGRYRFGLDHPLLDVEAAEFTVTSLHAPVTLTGDGPHARLADDGGAQVAAAAEAALTSCLDVTTLRTGCSFGFSTGTWRVDDAHGTHQFRPVENTATWSIDPGSTDLATTVPLWQTCEWFAPSTGDLSVCVEGALIIARAAVRTTTGGTESLTVQIVGYAADLSDPDHIQIAFGR